MLTMTIKNQEGEPLTFQLGDPHPNPTGIDWVAQMLVTGLPRPVPCYGVDAVTCVESAVAFIKGYTGPEKPIPRAVGSIRIKGDEYRWVDELNLPDAPDGALYDLFAVQRAEP